ncbi:MAG: MarR family winged helix-turn-helix transcriptional regulator [Candidatus Bathyarchaeia archaeon]
MRLKLGNIALTKRQVDVLIYLAKNGEANIYNIMKGTGLTYSTVHKSVKQLSELYLIRQTAEVKNEKGVTAKVYEITTSGLVAALASEKIWKEAEQVISLWSKKAPLTLKKWKHFTEYGLGEAIKQIITRIANETLGRIVIGGKSEPADMLFAKIFDDFFFDVVIEMPKGYGKELCRAVWSDPELKTWMIKHLEIKAKEMQAEAEIYMHIQRSWESPTEPDWDKMTRVKIVSEEQQRIKIIL